MKFILVRLGIRRVFHGKRKILRRKTFCRHPSCDRLVVPEFVTKLTKFMTLISVLLCLSMPFAILEDPWLIFKQLKIYPCGVNWMNEKVNSVTNLFTKVTYFT